jgi:hypothetical protein
MLTPDNSGMRFISSLFAPVYRSEVRLSTFSATTRLWRLGVDGDGNPFAERARLASHSHFGASEAAARQAPAAVVLVALLAERPAGLHLGHRCCLHA